MKYKYFIGLLFVLLSVVFAPQFAVAVTTIADGAVVACTMDAKMCPDGTYVGRSGSNCEFVCPATKTTLNTQDKPSDLPLGVVFKKGMTSDKLKDVQTILRADSSIYAGPVTGYYGALTEQAIKKLQAKYGLAQTGILDAATQAIIFPYSTQIELTVVSPNGGESWKAGETVNILWKASFGPSNPPCIPRPACLDSTPRCLPPEPVAGWCNDRRMLESATGASTGASTKTITFGQGVVLATDVQSNSSSVMPVMPFFPRATISLTRDGDASFSRVIGTVNLLDTQKMWTIPSGFPEANDYRVRISVGADTPCVFRAESEAKARGASLDANWMNPCPMMDLKMDAHIMGMANPAYSASDISDSTFAIIGGAVNDERILALKRQLAEIELSMLKLQEQVRVINDALNKLQSGQ